MLNGSELSPEAREMLPEAVKMTDLLYSGEMMQEALAQAGKVPSLKSEIRNTYWREIAEQYHPFRNKILGLRLALDNARDVYGNADAFAVAITGRSPEHSRNVVENIFERRFDDANDMGVRHLLKTVLCSRLTIAQGVLDTRVLVDTEADAMRKELGVMRGITALELSSLTLPNVVEAVLVGRLHLSRQTQSGN